MKLVWDTGEHAFDDLLPPFELEEGRRLADYVSQLIATGRMIRTNPGIQAWIAGGATQREVLERQDTIDEYKRFLDGRKMEYAGEAYLAGYRRFLAATPSAKAAMLIVRAIRAEHPEARWVGAPQQILEAVG